MALNLKFVHLIPDHSAIKSLFEKDLYNELLIFGLCYDSTRCVEGGFPSTKSAAMLVTALKNKLYEVINTGHWSQVDINVRKAFTLSTFFEVYFLLGKPSAELPQTTADSALYKLDFGLLLGCPLDEHENMLSEALNILSGIFSQHKSVLKLLRLTDEKRKMDEMCDIPILDRPALLDFQQNHFDCMKPAILTNCISHWPAMHKWSNPEYLASIAGNRTVPIEVGTHYSNDDWSQELVQFQEFLSRQIYSEESCDRLEYLAQHNLFDQVPALRQDLAVPEYCCISSDESETSNSTSPDIKAWLGPKGTISPMHHDPKHNLLCQIFGHKQVILAAPEDSENLYAHENRLLSNTSRVDAEAVDLGSFPRAGNVRWYRLNLYRGEMLYMPPGWWHHIRSLEKSFSVSFWWE